MRALIAAGRVRGRVVELTPVPAEPDAALTAIAGDENAWLWGLGPGLCERDCGCRADPRVFGHQHEGR